MGNTSVYGWPYPALLDDPNVPADMQALAEAIESTVVPVKALADSSGQLMRMRRYTSGSALATAVTTAVEILGGVDTGAVNYIAGRVYEVEFGICWDCNTGVFGNASNDTVVGLIRDTNTSGTVMVSSMFKQNGTAAVPMNDTWKFQYKPGSNVTKTFVFTMSRQTGTGTLTTRASSNGATYARVVDLGPASLVTDV